MVLKARENKRDIQSFSFGQLAPSSAIKSADDFKMQSLNKVSDFKNDINEAKIRVERQAESRSAFTIDKTVRELRGLTRQEKNDIENAVAKEVERRLVEHREQARKEGYEEGFKQGNEKAYAESKEKYDIEIQDFSSWLENARAQLNSILERGQQDAYHMIKHLVKWMTLKEIDDQEYLARLLEKLILEMNLKNNLVIRINKSSFNNSEDILQMVEQKLGKLTNTRVEAHLDLEHPGIVLECENGIVDASLNAQFSSLDKIFETVMKNNEQ